MYHKIRNNKALNKIIVIIIFFMSSQSIEAFLKCCDEESTKIKNEPNYRAKITDSSQTTQDRIGQKSMLKNPTDDYIMHATTALTKILAKGLTNFADSSAKQAPTSKQFSVAEKSIFTELNLNVLKHFFTNIDGIIYNQYSLENDLFHTQEKDSSNTNETLYLIHQNYRDFFNKHLGFISQKFINFIYQNLDADDIEKLAIEQITILDIYLSQFNNQIKFNAHYVFTKWLKQIAKDEIREKNITLEYVQSYIHESILPIIPLEGFQEKRLSEYKKLLLEKIMATDTQSEAIFNKKIIIQKYLQKNAFFINIFENIFTDLFLKKIKLLEAKPSAEAQNCMPHVVND